MNERDLFMEIWSERPHICTGCNKMLYGEPKAHYFSHIIPKGRRKDLKLVKDNIVIECIECHTLWETGSMEKKRKMLNFEYKLKYVEELDYSMYHKMKNI